MIKNIGILGGDERIINMAKILLKDGFNVHIYGIDEEYLNEFELDCSVDSLEKLVQSCEIVVGPIPLSQDDKFIFTPLFKDKIEVESLIKLLSIKRLQLIASVLKQNTKRLCELYNVKYYDLYEREELAILNAIPTVEGCVMIAIEKIPITLHSSHILILGFGRIGKLLAKTLKAFESNLYVAARKIPDLTWIKALGYFPVHLEQLKNCIGKMDLIINTIPAPILGEMVLDNVKKDSLIIDLASKPGGVDFEYAKSIGIRAIHALSLPGKVAPKTSAEYLIEALYNTFDEMGGQ